MSTTFKGTILIIEDEEVFSRVYQDLLRNDGYDTLAAEDGESGWQLTRSKKPDLVLLDLNLPKLHGLEVLKNIRGEFTTKNIPVVILTVFGDPEDIQKGLDLGADDYMVKGFYSPRELLAKIHSVLTHADIQKNIPSYKLQVNKIKGDATQLQQDIGLAPSSSFTCSHCEEEMFLELTPDYTRTDGHWFVSHFVCPKCHRAF